MRPVDVAVLYIGLTGAFSRFQGAGEALHATLIRDIRSSSSGVPPALGPSVRDLGPAAEVDSFIPLFEALNWGTSLEHRIKAMWPNAGEAKRWYEHLDCGATVRGVRFIRNCVHHQWSEALAIEEADRDLPARLAPWRWQPDLVAERPDPEGQGIYESELAGELVIGALGRMVAVFGKALRVLHDGGLADSELLVELLPVIDSMDARQFTSEAIAAQDAPGRS